MRSCAVWIVAVLLVACGKDCEVTWIDSPKGRLPVVDGEAFVRNETLGTTNAIVPGSWVDDWAEAYPEVRPATDDEAVAHAIRLDLCSSPPEQ